MAQLPSDQSAESSATPTSSSSYPPPADRDSLFHRLVSTHDSVLTPFLYSSAETSAWPSIILDGGGGSYLAPHIPQSPPSPLWSAHCVLTETGRQAVRSLHRMYLDAGADIISAVSYQAWQASFQKVTRCSDDEAEALMRLSVEVAVAARDEWWAEFESAHHEGRQRPLVAASIGCYGALLNGGQEYTGDYGGVSTAEVESIQRRRIAAVCAVEGVDVLLLETMANMDEVRALLTSTLPGVCPRLPVIVSLSAADAGHMRDGTPLREAFDFILLHARTSTVHADDGQLEATAVRGCAVVALGVNCCAPQLGCEVMQLAQTAILDHYHALLASHSISAAPSPPPCMPLPILYPNSGELWDAQRGCFHGERQLGGAHHASELTALIVGWYKAGARIVGGCCRTDDRYVRHVRDVLINRQRAGKASEEDELVSLL